MEEFKFIQRTFREFLSKCQQDVYGRERGGGKPVEDGGGAREFTFVPFWLGAAGSTGAVMQVAWAGCRCIFRLAAGDGWHCSVPAPLITARAGQATWSNKSEQQRCSEHHFKIVRFQFRHLELDLFTST